MHVSGSDGKDKRQQTTHGHEDQQQKTKRREREKLTLAAEGCGSYQRKEKIHTKKTTNLIQRRTGHVS
jgi:hypothetical protein